jgi:hypothetical protein
VSHSLSIEEFATTAHAFWAECAQYYELVPVEPKSLQPGSQYRFWQIKPAVR